MMIERNIKTVIVTGPTGAVGTALCSPADGGFCGARSCYSDLRLPAALYIENFTIFYHIMQAESYFLFFQKSPPIRNYRQVPDDFVPSPLPLL